MVGAVLVVVAGLVFAACGDPPKTADPTATLDLECEQCDIGKVYTAEITISAVAAIALDIDETNDPRGETILEYQIYEGGVFVPEGTETYNAPAGDSFVRFFYKCTRAGTARLRTAAYETGSDYSVAVFEIIKEIVCVPPAPPDIEVRGPNGGVIPSLGADAAGVNPHGVQFTREYTVKNVGTGPLSLMTATFSSQVNCTGAVLVQANPMMLAPGAMGSLTVGVTPTAPGAFECEWDLRNTDPDEDPYSVTVTGTAPSGDIAISAPSSTGLIADGGTQNVAFKPAGVAFTETYRIDNDGLAFLTVGQATIDTLVNCSVSIASQPIATPLPPQTVGATSLVLEITPLAAGAFMCNVSVPSTDPDAENPYTWTISGTATAPEIDVANFPDGSTDDVGAVRAGLAFSRSYMIANTGNGTLTITAATPINMTNCTLVVTMAPAGTIAPAGMTMVTVSVTPSEGLFTCDFDITNNDADEAFYDLAISGTGVLPKIALDGPNGNILPMTSDDLGSGHPATVAFSRTYTIRNTGTAPLTLSGVAVDMPTCNNCVDVITQPALTTVPVGGSTTFTIQWTPDAPGSFGHSYRISSDAGNGPLFLFATSGGASAAPAPDLRVLHSGLPIPSMTTENLGTFTSTAPIELDYTISNAGMANLDIMGVDSPGMPAPTNCTLVISGGSGTIIPGGSSTFHVTVTPQGTGSFSFQLRVFSNDTRFTMGYLFGVTGLIGLPSEIDIPGFPSASTDDAGSRSTGVSFVRTYTVNNSGSGSLTLGTASFSTSNCTASVSTVPASPVGAGGSTMIGITVTPTAAGAFACTFHLPNNDTTGAENPYDVTVSGTAIANIGNFGSMIGNYFGDNSCGIQGWSLKNVNGLKVDSFGSNPDDFPFAVGADPNVATATLLSIFGAPNHTCALTRVSNFTINIDCTNPGGGSCHEVASKL